MRRTGLLFYDRNQQIYDLILSRMMCFLYYGFFLEIMKFLWMMFWLDVRTSFSLCDQSFLMPMYRKADIMLIQFELVFFSAIFVFKLASENPQQLRWLRIYRQSRKENDLQYFDDDEWNKQRKMQNMMFLVSLWSFRTVFTFTMCSILIAPLHSREGQ